MIDEAYYPTRTEGRREPRGDDRLTSRMRIAFVGAALMGPLVAFPALTRPKLAIAFCLVVVALLLASKSVAYPPRSSACPGSQSRRSGRTRSRQLGRAHPGLLARDRRAVHPHLGGERPALE